MNSEKVCKLKPCKITEAEITDRKVIVEIVQVDVSEKTNTDMERHKALKKLNGYNFTRCKVSLCQGTREANTSLPD